MSITLRTARLEELPRILSCLDQEFVFGKSRRISLAKRFPTVYGPENIRNIYLLEEDGEILSSLACKQIKFNCDHNRWLGIMIGAVYTLPSRRGEHLGSHLLEKVTCKLRDREIDFAVLWAENSGFYSRLGWNTADAGVRSEEHTSELQSH